MQRLDQLAAALMLLLSLAAVAGTQGLAFWEESAPGPRFMPLAVAAASAVFAVLLFLDAARRRVEEPPVEWPARDGAIRLVLIMAFVVGFVVLAPWLGFIVGAGLFVLSLLLVVLRRRLVPSVATAAITAGLIQVIFVSWLGTALPRGVFGI